LPLLGDVDLTVPPRPVENRRMPTESPKDRSTGLLLFGIFEILLGVLCVGMSLMTVVGMLVMARAQPGTPTAPWPTLLPGVVVYLLLAAAMITVGVGSIRARRWARALILIGSWAWLAVGVSASLIWILLLPRLQTQMLAQMETQARAAGGPVPGPAFVSGMLLFMGVFLFVIYILLPSLFVFFYRSPHVRATCERRQPDPSWTDRVPLPLLGLSLAYGSGAAMLAVTAPLYQAIALFGRLWTGPIAVILSFIVAAVFLALGVGTYRRLLVAWWAGVACVILGIVSAVVSFRDPGLFDALYRHMGYSAEMIEMSRPYWSGHAMATATAASGVLFLGFLGYVRRHFVTAAGESQPAASI
jgi:hypothetical protein